LRGSDPFIAEAISILALHGIFLGWLRPSPN
jgi:hypothetical protein